MPPSASASSDAAQFCEFLSFASAVPHIGPLPVINLDNSSTVLSVAGHRSFLLFNDRGEPAAAGVAAGQQRPRTAAGARVRA